MPVHDRFSGRTPSRAGAALDEEKPLGLSPPWPLGCELHQIVFQAAGHIDTGCELDVFRSNFERRLQIWLSDWLSNLLGLRRLTANSQEIRAILNTNWRRGWDLNPG